MPVNPHVKGGTDVPVADGGTGASVAATGLANLGGLDTAGHATTNHAGIPGVGDLTTAAHSSLDHTGIPGVGSPVLAQEPATPASAGTITSEESLSSANVPANTLAANGNSVWAYFGIRGGSQSGGTADTRIRWGGAQIYSRTFAPGSPIIVSISVRIKRTGAGAQTIYVDDGMALTRVVGSADETIGNALAISNQNSSASNSANALIVDIFELEARAS